MTDYSIKQQRTQDAKEAIRLYQQRRISKDEALLIYKVWIDHKGIFHPIYFMSEATTIRFANQLSPQFINEHSEFIHREIDVFTRLSIERIHNQALRDLLEDWKALDDYYEEYYASQDEDVSNEQNDALSDLPFEELHSYFDGDPNDMADHFGDDWQSNL